MRCCSKSRGFTLLEVLIALIVLAVSLAAIAGEMLQMLNAATSMRERTYASWIAHNKIAELRLANVVPDTTTTSGEINYANQEWAWRAVITETGVPNLFRVDVTISFPGQDPLMRPVTGFIGEPVPPGRSNRVWNSLPESTEGSPPPGERR